jgi:hypothetical protein
MHLLNIHSWAPYPVNNGVGFTIVSNDILNTTSATAGFNYFTKDEASREFLDLSFARFFPVFTVGFSYGRNYNYFYDATDTLRLFKINEKVFSAGISIPLDFSRNLYQTMLTLGAGYKYIYTKYLEPHSDLLDVSAIELSAEFSRLKQLTYRDLKPRFGQAFNLTWWESLSGSFLEGNRLVTDAKIYLPGVATHHSLILSTGYQKSSPIFSNGIYRLTTDLEFVRGYKHETANQIIKGTCEYTLPLLYPDLEIGPLFYLKRINTNLFYDQGWITVDSNQKLYNSAGIDLNFEFNLFTIPAILWEVGVRYSFRFRDHGNTFEILLFGVPF